MAFGIFLLVASATSTPASELVRSIKREGLRVQVTLSNEEPQVAEPIELSVTVFAPTHLNLIWPDFLVSSNKDSIGGFSWTMTRRPVVEIEGGGRTETRTWLLESYRSGRLTIPAFEIRAGDALAVEVPSVNVRVVSDLPPQRLTEPVNPAWLGEFASPRDVPVTADSDGVGTGAWLVGGVVLAGLVVGIWMRLRSPSAARRALRQLGEVDSRATSGLAAEDALSSLADIWRRYLSDRWGLATASMTADEVANKLARQLDLDEDSAAEATRCVAWQERIEYAGHSISWVEVSQLIQDSRAWIARHDDREGVDAAEPSDRRGVRL